MMRLLKAETRYCTKKTKSKTTSMGGCYDCGWESIGKIGRAACAKTHAQLYGHHVWSETITYSEIEPIEYHEPIDAAGRPDKTRETWFGETKEPR